MLHTTLPDISRHLIDMHEQLEMPHALSHLRSIIHLSMSSNTSILDINKSRTFVKQNIAFMHEMAHIFSWLVENVRCHARRTVS